MHHGSVLQCSPVGTEYIHTARSLSPGAAWPWSRTRTRQMVPRFRETSNTQNTCKKNQTWINVDTHTHRHTHTPTHAYTHTGKCAPPLALRRLEEKTARGGLRDALARVFGLRVKPPSWCVRVSKRSETTSPLRGPPGLYG